MGGHGIGVVFNRQAQAVGGGDGADLSHGVDVALPVARPVKRLGKVEVHLGLEGV